VSVARQLGSLVRMLLLLSLSAVIGGMVRVCAYACNLIDITYLIWVREVVKCYVINSLENACRTVSGGRGCGGMPLRYGIVYHCLVT
jgi:hypothetical protein